MRYRLMHQRREGREIEPRLGTGLPSISVEKLLLPRLRQGEAQFIATDALWLHFKTRCPLEVGSSNPELIALFTRCADFCCHVVIDNRGVDFASVGVNRHQQKNQEQSQRIDFHSDTFCVTGSYETTPVAHSATARSRKPSS